MTKQPRRPAVSKLVWAITVAVLAIFGSATPTFAATVVVVPTGCSILSGSAVSTDIPSGFTVSGNLQLGVGGTTNCDVSWLVQNPVTEYPGFLATVSQDLNLQVDLSQPFTSSAFLLVFTTHQLEGSTVGPDAFASSLFFPTISAATTVFTDHIISRDFPDAVGPDSLVQQFEFSFSTPSVTTVGLNFSVTSQSFSPEPATAWFLLAGVGLLAARARRRRITSSVPK